MVTMCKRCIHYNVCGNEACCDEDDMRALTFCADFHDKSKLILTDDTVGEGYLHDWYIASVDDSEPIWTEAHIAELCGDFILIPKENTYERTT